MNAEQLRETLNNLITAWESEAVEFKRASSDYDTDKIGKYFSALSNEANLRGLDRAWLVFGVDNKTRAVVGTNYRPEHERLQSLKMQISQDTLNTTFHHIYELNHEDGRVILFEIPPAPLGMPIPWKGHYYARSGESLAPMGLGKLDEIRQQTMATDWSAQIVPNATLDDLDEEAIAKARSSFAKKYANRFSAEEMEGWSDETFLNRAKITQDGKITRTALLLLGKPEATYLLSPHPAQITWKLEGVERAYEHFGLPFLLSTSWVYKSLNQN
jgi:ATP-dependent DNA helicase RecG